MDSLAFSYFNVIIGKYMKKEYERMFLLFIFISSMNVN